MFWPYVSHCMMVSLAPSFIQLPILRLVADGWRHLSGEPAPGFKKEETAAPAEPAEGADGQGGEQAEAKAEEKEASVKVEKAEAKKKKEKSSEAGGSVATEGLESGLKKAAKRKPERAEGAPPKKPRQEGHVSEKQK
jgi:hypothetical protein